MLQIINGHRIVGELCNRIATATCCDGSQECSVKGAGRVEQRRCTSSMVVADLLRASGHSRHAPAGMAGRTMAKPGCTCSARPVGSGYGRPSMSVAGEVGSLIPREFE